MCLILKLHHALKPIRVSWVKESIFLITQHPYFMQSINCFILILFSFVYRSTYAQITPLDYSNPANWSAHFSKLADLTIRPSYTILGADTTQRTVVNIPYPPANSLVDVFALSPTTLIDPNEPAATIPLTIVQKSAINLSNQLAFSQLGKFGRIYAPYYRQANLKTYTLPVSQQNKQAAIFDTAAADALAAFAHYMQNDNKGKKVILAGHSQGALVLAMILRKMETNPEQYRNWLDKIVVSVLVGMEGGAYVKAHSSIGGWLQNIPICHEPEETGCVVTWATVKDGLPYSSSIPIGNTIAVNAELASKGLKYAPFIKSTMEQTGDPLIYSTASKMPVSRSIYPRIYIAKGAAGISTDWVAYDQFYQARIINPDAEAWGIAVEKIPIPGDQRHDPIAGAIFADLHLYDMHILMGTAIEIIAQKLAVTTSLESKKLPEVLNLYPNPAAESINLDIPFEQFWVTVFDHVGRRVLVLENTRELEVKSWNKGLYIIKVTNGDKEWLGKLVKN